MDHKPRARCKITPTCLAFPAKTNTRRNSRHTHLKNDLRFGQFDYVHGDVKPSPPFRRPITLIIATARRVSDFIRWNCPFPRILDIPSPRSAMEVRNGPQRLQRDGTGSSRAFPLWDLRNQKQSHQCWEGLIAPGSRMDLEFRVLNRR